MPDQNEIDVLKTLLREDYDAALDATERHPVDGFVTVHQETKETKRWNSVKRVITRGPSGQHYAWEWWCGLTESQESFGPAEWGDPVVTPVRATEETVVVTKWVPDA